MQLLASKASPYARKVRVKIIEIGLSERVPTVWVDPLGADVQALHRANPLGKVPALVLDDGPAVFDSPVICTVLDEIVGAAPSTRDVRIREALADGIMDAAFALVMERRRPDPQRSTDWISRWTEAIARAVAEREASGVPPQGRFDTGDIALACALAYLDFRLGDLRWDTRAPSLRAWLIDVSGRPSLAATAPG